ncbi:hypothetical protein D3C81_1032610 [compost metagenome]
MADALLLQQLEAAEQLPCELPAELDSWLEWSRGNARRTASHYAEYLAARRRGEPRRYFGCRAHALYFLRQVAPTKLVDGAWLYGALRYWQDFRLQPLVRTYLEELGEGDAALNHVRLYRSLLDRHECLDGHSDDDRDYLQGALQLWLGNRIERFLPELIGYNLGYEQLPLHLLISAYELEELGIDPWYFRVHVTIDNVSTGHAYKAIQAAILNCPAERKARDEYLHRLSAGYRLNELGTNSLEAIARFDLEQELLRILRAKRVFGLGLHSDRCRIAGRTVNQWLAGDDRVAEFLGVLETQGWIRRNDDPRQSRFWRLLEGDHAAMLGVFSRYEREVLYDWIAGTWQSGSRPPCSRVSGEAGEDAQVQALRDELQQLSPEAGMARLVAWMAPACHDTPAGLYATREFVRRFA